MSVFKGLGVNEFVRDEWGKSE